MRQYTTPNIVCDEYLDISNTSILICCLHKQGLVFLATEPKAILHTTARQPQVSDFGLVNQTDTKTWTTCLLLSHYGYRKQQSLHSTLRKRHEVSSSLQNSGLWQPAPDGNMIWFSYEKNVSSFFCGVCQPEKNEHNVICDEYKQISLSLSSQHD